MTEKSSPLTRRRALTGAAGVGIALPVLAACAGDDGPTAADDGAGGATGSASTPPASGKGEPFAPAADIEVGGGAIYPDEQVVITQPSEGEFKAFSAICTHQGCTVAEISSEGIVCRCHSSVFAIDDGSPLDGPATAPLEELGVRVEGGQVFLG